MANKWYKHVKIKNIFIIAFTHYIVIMVFESPVGRKEATMHQCSYNGMHWLIYLLGRQRCGNLQSALFLNRHKKSIFCIYSSMSVGMDFGGGGGAKLLHDLLTSTYYLGKQVGTLSKWDMKNELDINGSLVVELMTRRKKMTRSFNNGQFFIKVKVATRKT